MMDKDHFCALISDEFGLESVKMSDRIIEDLGFDSMDVLDLVTLIDEEGEVVDEEVPPRFPLLDTVSDAYSYYVDTCTAHGGTL